MQAFLLFFCPVNVDHMCLRISIKKAESHFNFSTRTLIQRKQQSKIKKKEMKGKLSANGVF